MLGRPVSVLILALLLLGMLSSTSVVASVGAYETKIESEASIDFEDLRNGTTLILIDYHNGTVVEGRITYYPGKGSLHPIEVSRNQTSQLEIQIAGNSQSVDNVCMHTVSQEILFGFTWRWDIIPEIEIEIYEPFDVYFKIEIGAGVGLRLPVRITLDYPETMLPNEYYTINATLHTLDWDDWDELLLYFNCGGRLTSKFGEIFSIGWWHDYSASFETPLGDIPIPIPQIGPFTFAQGDIFLVGGVSAGISIGPKFYCNRIEAEADIAGNASIANSSFLVWNTTGDEMPLKIHTNDTGTASITIQDFKYIIDRLMFDFNFVLDWYGLILGHIPDWEMTIFTWDASDFLPDLEIGVHTGYPESVGVNIFVEPSYEPFAYDLVVTDVTTATHAVYEGTVVRVFVTVENRGTRKRITESFTVIAYCDNDTVIGTRLVEGLSPEENKSLIFRWDTIDTTPGWHTLRAEATAVRGEIDVTNNQHLGNPVKINMFCDINGDNVINIYDLVAITSVYGSKQGDLNWNELADMAPQYGKIDIYDVVTCLYHYGETYP